MPPQPEYLLFERGGVIVAVRSPRYEATRRTILLSFEVPEHQTVRLSGSILEATTAQGVHARSPMTGVWYGARNRSTTAYPESLLTGRERLRWGTLTGYGRTRHDFYVFTAEFATPLGDRFTLTLPEVRVNGIVWELPPIEFRRVRRWVISPLNC